MLRKRKLLFLTQSVPVYPKSILKIEVFLSHEDI